MFDYKHNLIVHEELYIFLYSLKIIFIVVTWLFLRAFGYLYHFKKYKVIHLLRNCENVIHVVVFVEIV